MHRFIPFSLILMLSSLSLASFPSGGISGGGGNVIAPVSPDQAVSPELAKHMVHETIPQVFEFLCGKSQLIKNAQASTEEIQVLAPLFNRNDQGQNIFDVIKSTQVHVADQSPCFDSGKNPVDGSVISTDSNSICLSALTSSQKVRAQDIPAQAAALMVHEFSERFGFGEDQSVIVQTLILKEWINALGNDSDE